MPSIDVIEKDMSWYYRTQDPSALTVLTPIVSTWGPYNPTMVDASNFTSVYGTDIVDSHDLSYPIAASLVKSGLTLLCFRVGLGGTEASCDIEDPTAIPVDIVAKYDGTLGNALKVDTSNIKSVKSIPYDDVATDTADTWDTGKTYLYLGDTTTEGTIRTKNHVYSYIDDTWTDVGKEKILSFSFVVKVSIAGAEVESLVYELLNPDSQYYYDAVNQSSSYVKITPKSDIELNKLITATNITGCQMAGGTNGESDHDTVVEKLQDTLVSGSESSYGGIVDNLLDPLVFDFDIVISAGYNYFEESNEATCTVDDSFVELVANRKTAIYLVDAEPGLGATEFFEYCGNKKFEQGANYTNAGSYCAAYGPWCYAQLLSTGVTRLVPGSYVFLIAWARATSNGAPLYLAPAGVKRSSLGTIVRSTVYPIGSAIINAWQNDPAKNYKINPIAKLKQYGYVVYGNSTLLKNDPVTGEGSMLQSFSTRVTMNLIKRRAFDISLTLQFDQIDSDIFAEFKTTLSTFMNELKYNKAIYDYRIIADRSRMTLDELNQRTVPVKILVSPSPAAENFEISLEIYPAGVIFGDDTLENLRLPVGD